MSDVRPTTPELLVPATMFAAQDERVLYMDGAKESETGWRTTSLGILLPDTADQKLQGAMPLHVDNADVLLWNEVTRARARENGAMVMWLENEGQSGDQINAERERLDFYIQLQQAMGGKLIVGAKDHRAGDLIKYYKADGVFTTDSVEGLIDGIGNALLADAEFIANNPGEYVTDRAEVTVSSLDRPTISSLTGNPIHDAVIRQREHIEVQYTPDDDVIAAERLRSYVKVEANIINKSSKFDDSKYAIKHNAVWLPATGTFTPTDNPSRKKAHKGKDPWYVEARSYIAEHGNNVHIRVRTTPNNYVTIIEHVLQDHNLRTTDNCNELATIKNIRRRGASVTLAGKPITVKEAYLAYLMLSSTYSTVSGISANAKQYNDYFRVLVERAEAS